MREEVANWPHADPSVKVRRMDEIMDLRNAETIKGPATNNAHAAASADEASGATTATVGNATDDGLTSSSSAARDTPQGGDEATIYAKRTFHN